jgi:hypothetical protein
MRRFVLAAVGTSCAVVAIEYGGRAHGFELTEYCLTSEGWNAGERHALSSEPKSTNDLLQRVDRGMNLDCRRSANSGR